MRGADNASFPQLGLARIPPTEVACGRGAGHRHDGPAVAGAANLRNGLVLGPIQPSVLSLRRWNPVWDATGGRRSRAAHGSAVIGNAHFAADSGPDQAALHRRRGPVADLAARNSWRAGQEPGGPAIGGTGHLALLRRERGL